MSLSKSGLANGTNAPAYVYPATSADGSASINTGTIPEGSLLMLPPEFNDSAITHPMLKRIVATLKTHGAYIVDRNTGTPFVIYVENGSNFKLMPNGWDPVVIEQLRLTRAGLRRVTSAESWIDGDGNVKAEPEAQNILSMRGGWFKQEGPELGVFDTLRQEVVFRATPQRITQANTNYTGFTKVSWALPAVGQRMRFSSVATGNASVRLQLRWAGETVYDSGYLKDGQSTTFYWPADDAKPVVLTRSGVNTASSVKGLLIAD